VSGATRSALKVGAAALLPMIAGYLGLCWGVNKLGDWYAQGHDELERAVRDEVASWRCLP
jgi:hypothetical protein